MNRLDLSARLREVVAVAHYDPVEAIKLLCEIIKELNDEIEGINHEAEK